MNWFKPTIKTDKELQDELKALVDKVIAQQVSNFYEMDRYESLLREIYSRNLVPCVKLKPKSN